MMIKGVNLGNWLVLEKWMEPEMFAGVEAEDETYLCKLLPEKEKRRRYEEHRKTYVTEQDFQDIAAAGFQMVRIPVPYFLFDDKGPFLPCYQYLDAAFDWADRWGLKIWIDLHTVPGGHNGTDNSGICGVCTWSTRQEYLDETLDVLEKIAKRYGTKDALWGIEPLNEPMCSDTPISASMNIQLLSQVYHAQEPELARDNTNYPLAYLRDFYRAAYARMRKYLPVEKAVVFSDAFYLEGWEEFFAEEQFQNIVLDTHQYLTMVEYGFGEERPLEKYLDYLKRQTEVLRRTASKLPVVVGEWSMGNSMTGYENASFQENTARIQKLYQAYRKMVDVCDGWFYWSYKLLAPEPEREVWDMRKCLKNGWAQIEEG